VYDSGDYATALEVALAAAGYADLRDEQAKRRAAGDAVQLGIGLACYVEITGAGSEAGLPRENATVEAFLEEVVYDADGNPLTATFADYPFLSAAEVPSFELADMATPTTYNPLGAKGIGEAGTIGATPAVQNAVVDAVSHLGVRHIDMPRPRSGCGGP